MAWSSARRGLGPGCHSTLSPFRRIASRYFWRLLDRTASSYRPAQNGAPCHSYGLCGDGFASCQSATAVMARSTAWGSTESLNGAGAGGRGGVVALQPASTSSASAAPKILSHGQVMGTP